MTGPLPMGVTVSVHMNESALVETRVTPGHGHALVTLRSEFGPTLDLYFCTVPDLDRVLEGLSTARHEFAALTEHTEPVGDTANTTMTTHAEAGVS